MAVIGNAPMWRRADSTSDWQELDHAEDYTNWNSTRRRSHGNYPENLLAFTRITRLGFILIYAYIGSDVDAGIYYDFETHSNVREALGSVASYSDFYVGLKQLGYSEQSATALNAIAKLQSFVDLARG